MYNVTAADLGGETSDPEVWPTPLGGPLAPPTGSASLMESRSFTGPHVGSMVGSDRKYSAKRPATHKASWAKAFELGEHLINTGSTTRELSGGLPDNLPGRRSTLDIDMQEILGQAWFGSVDGDSCLDPGLATACHRQQLSPKRQLGKVNNENAGNELHDASKAAHGSKGKSRSQRRSIAEKWVATLPPGRRPNVRSRCSAGPPRSPLSSSRDGVSDGSAGSAPPFLAADRPAISS